MPRDVTRAAARSSETPEREKLEMMRIEKEDLAKRMRDAEASLQILTHEAEATAKWEAKRKKAELEAKRRAEFSRLNQDDVIAGCDPSKLAATRSYIEGLIDGVVTKKEVVAVLRELGVSMTYISSKASAVERLKGHYKRRYGW